MENQKIDKDKILSDLNKEPRFNRMVLVFIVLCTACILFFSMYSCKVTWNTILFVSFILVCVFGFFLFLVIPDEIHNLYIKKQVIQNKFYIEECEVKNIEKIRIKKDIVYRTYFYQYDTYFDFDYKMKEKDIYLLVFLKKRKKQQPYLLMAYPFKTFQE